MIQTFVRDVFGPTLRPGDLVVMDNLAPQKNETTLRLIGRTVAAACFPPAYSPALKLGEKMWSKVKQFLRSAEARTGEELQASQ